MPGVIAISITYYLSRHVGTFRLEEKSIITSIEI